ncbi:MAG: hypothetical protein Phog2KO_26360 [Phototrophicaceae bacterium]
MISLTVATNGQNKCNPATLQWQTVHSWTANRFFQHVATDGHPVAVGVYQNSIRRKDAFLSSQVIGLDFDALTQEQAISLINHPFVQGFASFTYSTPSHSQELPRLRVFFILDRVIKSAEKYEVAVRRVLYLFRSFQPDKACKDSARFFYGNNAPDFAYTVFLGNVLPLSQIGKLKEPDENAKTKVQTTQELPRDFINSIERSLRFTGVKHGDFLECHCPIHPPDEEPSAGWHPEKHFLFCFHDGKHYLAKEVGQALGMTMYDYVAQSHTNDDCLQCIQPCTQCIQPLSYEKTPLSIHADFPEIKAETVAWYAGQNEYGDAQLFVKLTGHRVVYDHSEKSWYWWQGHWWQRDESNKTAELLYAPVGETYAKAAGTFTTRLATLEAQDDIDESQLAKLQSIKKELEKRPRSLRTHSRASNVLKIASGLQGIKGNEWDKNTHLLGVKNGVVDLSTGNHIHGRKTDYIRKVANVAFEPTSNATRWRIFIEEILNDDKDVAQFIQRLFGYMITGITTDHVLPVFYGRGRNGKDTLIETIGDVLGDYANAGTSNLLIDQTNFSGQANPHIHSLMGKRLVWVTETSEGSRLNVNQVKYLTGAGRITARPLYGNPIEFDSTHHIVLFTNHKPRVPSENEDYAIWQRLLLIPLTLSFVENPTSENERPRDPDLKKKLKTERQGILNWLIEGCLEWQRQGLNPPESIRIATREYARSEDFIGLFLDECCVISPYVKVPANELLRAYNQWASDTGFPELSARKLSDQLSKQFDKTRTSQGMLYNGLSLRK